MTVIRITRINNNRTHITYFYRFYYMTCKPRQNCLLNVKTQYIAYTLYETFNLFLSCQTN